MRNATSTIGIACISLCLCAGCHREQRSWVGEIGTKIAKNDRESEAFKKRLAEWFVSHGFTTASGPGGMASWSGVHREGEINSWYRGSFHDSPPILLCVRIFPRKDVGGGFTEFHFSQVWDVAGSPQYVADMEALSKEFETEFVKGVSLEKE